MMKSSKRRLQSLAEGSDIMSNLFKIDQESECSIPPVFRSRLHDLFSQIEKEFDLLYAENLNLQEKIEVLSERLEREAYGGDKSNIDSVDFDVQGKSTKQKLIQSSQKVKASHKLKVQTSKIVSSFKTPTFNCQLAREFTGHKDGVWEVSCARPGQPLVGSASADYSAAVWSVEWGKCLLQYLGHSGSVNSIRFHPSRDLALTSSGDATAHVWQAAVNWDLPLRGQSSEEELEGGVEDGGGAEDRPECLRTPLVELLGHSGVVVAADWLPGADQVITASWDRSANLYDVETGELLHCLTGHDHELTHASAHFSQRLVVTASRDTTFRLWDFREPIHSVSVFQGHTESVTSAVFTREDKVVSGSDDRSVKVWDLRNMRSSLATIRSDSSVNRIAVSSGGLIAIPHDNRQIRLFDLQGQRMARLPRTSRMGHRRMVTSVAWVDEMSSAVNFFSCGFDRRILGWSIQPSKET